MNKVLKKSFLLIALSLFLLANVAKADVNAEFQNVIRTDVNTLFRELSENIVRFDQRYRNQVIELTGTVSASGIGSGINPYSRREEFFITLRGEGLTPHTIRIFFSDANRNQVARLEREQSVVVRGRFIRFVDGSAPIMSHLAGNAPILTNSSVAVFGATREQREAEEARFRAQQAQEQQARQEAAQVLATTMSTSLEGVVINGVRWATRNVDAPGVFAATPESRGEGYTWSQRDVCPRGWRVPTQIEFESLINAGYVRIVHNDVRGALFGVAPNQIFLPERGYWSSTYAVRSRAGLQSFEVYRLSFSGWISVLSASSESQRNRYSIRCVSDASLTEIRRIAQEVEIEEQARREREEVARIERERVQQEEQRIRQEQTHFAQEQRRLQEEERARIQREEQRRRNRRGWTIGVVTVVVLVLANLIDG